MARILLVNKFYYPRGGDCTAVLTTERLLKAKGHAVAVFSMQHPDNIASPYDAYFPEEISFSARGLYQKMKAAVRIFRSSGVVAKFNQILNDFKPDVVHLHNIHSYLSPVIAQVAHTRGIRVVWTLHDYKLICPAYNCLRAGKPCELCYTDKLNVLTHRCMKNSRVASLLAWMEAVYWNRKKLERITDRFISPSFFLKEKMVSAGFRSEQIDVLHNFMHKENPSVVAKEDYYCYVGRLSEEKGVETLLEAAQHVPFPLKIIGGGPLLDRYKTQYPQANIEFSGQLPFEQLLPIVQRARFLVLPSIWYENNPYSVIEALCMGTPVLGAKIGGIPELIEEGINGLSFESGNPDDLRNNIRKMYEIAFDYHEIAQKAQNSFLADTYYNRLLEIYNNKYIS
ncbi:MAG: glycosyltransferase [Tannerella sp.]|jgi:glycosyltransferase involved in cell wall biosynthesis|nr:glycosyltransferase [Tannerella sp.]